MQLQIVKKLFDEIIDRYSGEESTASGSPIRDLFSQWIKKYSIRKKLDVVEFGGAAGQLLKEIAVIYPNVSLTNVEIIRAYKKYAVSKSIRFVRGSLLAPPFPDHSFDVLIIRDVLHHLVGKTHGETLVNQKRGLIELHRLVRGGGVIFIEEITVGSRVVSSLLYRLAKINSVLGIRLPFFHISPHAVILFFTPQRLTDLTRAAFGPQNIKISKLVPHHESWRYRLVHLGARIGKMLIVIESPQKNQAT